MFAKAVLAIVLTFFGWKAWKLYQQPSYKEIRSLSEALAFALCDATLVDKATSLDIAVKKLAESVLSSHKNTNSMSEAAKIGIQYAQDSNELTASRSVEIRAKADPLFESRGWSAARIQRLLKALNGNAKQIVELGAGAASSCGGSATDDQLKADAAWILRAYLVH